jgi:hypothetical protein
MWLLGGLVAALLLLAPLIGLFAQPWAPIWFGQHAPQTIHFEDHAAAPVVAVDVPQIAHGFVSDGERYLLARAAGFSPVDAITATAISIAEDGSGDPAALSGVNFNGSRDLGLWQITSGWWPQFGGHDALVIPINNAKAALAIYGKQGWCAWSTYEERCGTGHIGSYRAFLERARRVAQSG